MLQLLLYALLLQFVQCFQQKPWVQKNIGAIDVLEFDPSQADVAFAASKEGILAAINVRTGKLRWRQVLPEGEHIEKMVVHKHRLITLSAGRITRVWKSLEGDLVWEDGHFDQDYIHPKEAHDLGNADIQLVHVNNVLSVLTLTVTGEIRLRGLNTANEYWDINHDHHHTTPARAITVDDDQEHIFTIAFPEDSHHLQVTVFQVKDGLSLGSRTFELRHPVSTSNVLFKGQYLIMLGSGDSPDIDIMFLDDQFNHRPTHFNPELPSHENYAIHDMPGDFFSVQCESQSIIYQIEHKGLINQVRSYKPIRAVDEIFSMAIGAHENNGDVIVGSIRQNFDGAEVEWYDLFTKESNKQMVPFYDHHKHGDVLRIFPRLGKTGVQSAVILSEDFALTLVKNGNSKPVWVREESLAMISQMKIIDFPVELEASQKKSVEDSFSNFGTRLAADIQYMKAWLDSYLDEGFSSKTDPQIFGFRKLIVALSSSGKIFGVDSLSGKIRMKKFLPTLNDGCIPTRFFLSQEIPKPLFTIISACEASCKVLNFDIISQIVTTQSEVQGPCSGVFPLPGNSIALKYQETMNVFPESKTSDFKANAKDTIFFDVVEEESRIQGFAVNPTTLATWPAWNFNFGPGESLLHLYQREDTPKVADTLYRPGGNRAVMLKYLNPHMIIAITQVREQDGVDKRGPWFDGINVYLIDSVTGAVIDHIIHQNAVSPVALVTYENRVVYSFWNREKQHNTVIGLSLWLKRSKDKTKTDGFSSYTIPKPEVLQKAWLFNAAPITGLAISDSRFGFAGRTILATLSSGQIYAMDSKFVDPRQVEGDLKPADKEEQLMPYTPNIPYIHPKIITSGNEVARVRGIKCGSAKVESTSLVVAYGVDLFATLMTPNAFDMLGDDFDKSMLMMIVVAVLVAIAVSRHFAKEAKLTRLWT